MAHARRRAPDGRVRAVTLFDQPTAAAAPGTTTPASAISTRRLVGAASTIALGNVLSRALGLVREQVIAATFGLTGRTDAYFVARAVPVIVYDLLVGSVITAAFVPAFVQSRDDPRQLWRAVSAVLTLAALALATVVVALSLAAEPLLRVIAPGIAASQPDLGVRLMRLALVSVVFQGLAGVLASVLYALDRFTLPAFAVAVYNTGIIVGVVALAPMLGIYALVAGLVLGALGQLLLQASGVRAFWPAYRPRIDVHDPAVQRVLALAGPVAAGMLVTIAGYFIDLNLASRLAAGSLSAKQYATTLVQFPLGMVGMATSFAVLPTLSRFGAGADENLDHYRATLLFGIKLILLLMLPAFVGLAALAQPIVAILFERGAFKSSDTALTASIFLAFAPQLPFTAIDYLLINAFYARQDVRTPVLVGVVGTALFLAVALALIQPLGVVGLALADAAKNSAHALILLALLGRRLPALRLAAGLLPFLARVAPAAAAMGAAIWLAWPALGQLGDVLGVIAAIAVGAVLYAVLLQLLGVPEARAAVALVRGRVGR